MVLKAVPGTQVVKLLVRFVVELVVAHTMLALGSEEWRFGWPRDHGVAGLVGRSAVSMAA
jgi:hypothetical protein